MTAATQTTGAELESRLERARRWVSDNKGTLLQIAVGLTEASLGGYTMHRAAAAPTATEGIAWGAGTAALYIHAWTEAMSGIIRRYWPSEGPGPSADRIWFITPTIVEEFVEYVRGDHDATRENYQDMQQRYKNEKGAGEGI